MDLGIVGALLLLVGWAVATLALGAPGWSNALLTAGVFLLIWRIVVRGTPPLPPKPLARDAARRQSGTRKSR